MCLSLALVACALHSRAGAQEASDAGAPAVEARRPRPRPHRPSIHPRIPSQQYTHLSPPPQPIAAVPLLNDVQNNPLQPDLQYRGFSASLLLGSPQGISLYQNGVRSNEPFGEVWAGFVIEQPR